jgi:hypothetical protein
MTRGQARNKPKGWVKEPVRHGLAAKGIKTVGRHELRKIGGQRFQRMSTHRHKPDAIERAEWARSRGFNARVIRIGKGLFAVFTRRTKRRREREKKETGMFWG